MFASYSEIWRFSVAGVWFAPQVQTIVPFSISFKDLEPSVPLTFACNVKGGRYVWSPEEYEKFAAECLRWSRIVTDVQSKAKLLQMATTWTKVAERLRTQSEKEAA